MKKISGFTLIELVVVIIVLGVLSATALPKFIGLQSDARVATLEGVKGAFESASTLIYSKATIDGMQKFSVDENQLSGYTVEGTEISYGYPIVGDPDVGDAENLMEVAGLSRDDWDIITDGTVDYYIGYIYHKDNYDWSERFGKLCYASYQQVEEIGEKPIITIKTEDC